MNKEHAGCYCGNISAEVTLTKELSEYIPRACDCDFCIKNGAAYISDPEGSIKIKINQPGETTLFRQGDNLVELLICKICGVLVTVTYTGNNSFIGGLNSKTLVNRSSLPPCQTASPKLLSASQKVERWKEIWFPEISIDRASS